MWRRKKDKPNVVLCTPSQVCYEIDLYTINHDETLMINNLKDKYVIEKEAFKKQENKYKPILLEIAKYSTIPRVINKDNYRLFIEFIITIKRRNPFIKNHLTNALPKKIEQEFNKEHLRDFLKKMCKEVGQEVDVDVYLENYTTTKIKDPKRISDLYLSGFIDIQDSILRRVTNDLYQYKQKILFAPIGTQFITSDNPGFTVIGEKAIPFGGFGSPFQFYFPLTPNCCLLIDSSQKEENSMIEKTIYPIVLDGFEVSKINRLTKMLSTKSIFSHSKQALERL